MKHKTLVMLLLAACCVLPISAQRKMDVLSRGLVAVKTDNGVFLSWRRLGEEYYDVTYNVYRDGTKLNATPLTVSNYSDTKGTNNSSYTVKAVVRGVEQAASKAVTPWNGYVYGSSWSGFFDIRLARVYDNSGNDITSTYIANDAEVADLDGDGEMEIIIKRISTKDANDLYVSRTDGAYDRFDAYKLDGTLLWWIDAGPNMVSGGSHEFNLIAYDWDGDGKAEVLLRGGDDMMVHGQRGASRTEYPQRIGSKGVDTRGSVSHTANMTYTNQGGEYLVYMDGDHGIIYDAVRWMEYPLTRGNASDWGDDYGHRSSKYFFGAPFLDGRSPSIFLARGIYTRHKMVAYDVTPSTHTLTQKWYWECNDSNSPWYGNGNHNYCIADVDLDGRDEIVYGSMVIDDNGKGLSTTGLGHGDALHCSDFDPYRHGLEIYACNEDEPFMNYRNATTSQMYYRVTGTGDDGRAICANVSNNYPGAMGRSASTGIISCVKDAPITELGEYITDLNFRIYWDGDLLSEMFNSPGIEREAKIEKPGSGRLFTSSGCKMNNWTKNTPCFLGDIVGDWREEFIARKGEGNDTIRIYTTGMPTEHDIYTLWHDHQYRQAMVWQMHAYNQPPHLSYFLGEMEGYTQAPPPLTTNGRTEIASGTTIGTGYNEQHLLHCQYANTSLNVQDGAAPYILTINVPTWVQGTNSNSTTNPTINRTTYTCNLNGGALTGEMRLVKQGDGILNMAAATHTYTGETDVWGGTVNFNGKLMNSPVTLRRHTTLNSSGGGFHGGVRMEYGATLNVGGANSGSLGTVDVGTLDMAYGAKVVLDYNGSGDTEHDWLNATKLIVDDSKVGVDAWENYGPEYIAPVVQIRFGSNMPNGIYPIGNVQEVEGDLTKVRVITSGVNTSVTLVHQDGKLYANVGGTVPAAKPEFAIIGMREYNLSSIYPDLPGSDHSFLPVVSITPTATSGITPTLSGTFTSLDGVVTTLGSTATGPLVYEDYQSATGTGDWNSSCNIYLNTDDGRCIKIASENSSGTRRAYKTFYSTGTDFYGAVEKYTVEFDAQLHRTNSDAINEVVLFGEGAGMPAINAYFNSTGDNYLFRLTGGNNNTNYAVEGSSATASLGDTWCHFTVTIDKNTRLVTYQVAKGSSVVLQGSYTANAGANMNVQGLGVALGRAWSWANIDNIRVMPEATDFTSYAFTKPGTLTVTADLNESGYAPSSATFVVEKPYVIKYESPDYNTIAATDAASVLGANYWYTNENIHVDCRNWTRFANWANITYSFAIYKINSSSQTMYVDQDKTLWVDYTGNLTALHLVEGYGLAQSGGATFHAANLGDDRTIIYHRYDYSLGNAANLFQEYTYAPAEGTYSYGNTLGALQKFIAWVPLEKKYLWGDLNHDGDVTIVDVTLLVNFLLNNDNGQVVATEADLNADGTVTVVDVTVLVNYLLSK